MNLLNAIKSDLDLALNDLDVENNDLVDLIKLCVFKLNDEFIQPKILLN